MARSHQDEPLLLEVGDSPTVQHHVNAPSEKKKESRTRRTRQQSPVIDSWSRERALRCPEIIDQARFILLYTLISPAFSRLAVIHTEQCVLLLSFFCCHNAQELDMWAPTFALPFYFDTTFSAHYSSSQSIAMCIALRLWR